MAVNKLDPKIIFASEAPAQDTPAVFNNRTLGWGESRKNGGRPTIKQMNALQQDTELKILWLNENAVTPFDATIDYPVNAVTIKDGQFKIFNGTSWNLFLDKSSVGLNNVDNTSDLNKPISTAVQTKLDYIHENGAALPYKEGIAYEENAVVVKDGALKQWKGGVWVVIKPEHNDLSGRDASEAHPASAILDVSGKNQQELNSKIAEVKSFSDYSASNSTVSNTSAIASIATDQTWVYIPNQTYDVTENVQGGAFGLIGVDRNSKLRNLTALQRTVMMRHGATRPTNGIVENLKIEDTKADGSNDNFGAIFLYGVDDTAVINNTVSPSTVGISTQHGDAALGEYTGNIYTEDRNKCQSRNTLFAYNKVKDASFMGYEVFSSLKGRFIGNVADNEGVTQGTQHGYRFTGYAGMPCAYNAAVGNVSDNFANGVSIQNAVKYNSFSAFQTNNSINGLVYQINLISNEQANRNNYVQMVNHKCNYGAFLYNPAYNYFNLIVDEATTTGILLKKDSSSFGYAKNNIVDGIVTNSASGARVETDGNILRLVTSELASTGLEVVGNNNIIDLVVDNVTNAGARYSLVVSGNKNIIRTVSSNNNTPMNVDVLVSGADNDITLHAARGVACTGARNTLSGSLGAITSLAGSSYTVLEGTVSSIVRGGTNTDYSGLRGASGRSQVSTTTNANGEVTITVENIPTGLTVMGAIAQYSNFNNNRYVVVKSCAVASNTLTIVLKFCKDDGTVAASESVFAYYQYFAY